MTQGLRGAPLLGLACGFYTICRAVLFDFGFIRSCVNALRNSVCARRPSDSCPCWGNCGYSDIGRRGGVAGRAGVTKRSCAVIFFVAVFIVAAEIPQPGFGAVIRFCTVGYFITPAYTTSPAPAGFTATTGLVAGIISAGTFCETSTIVASTFTGCVTILICFTFTILAC